MESQYFKSLIRKKGFTQESLSHHIGLSLSRFNAKVNNKRGAEFKLGEALALRKLLSLTADEFEIIFLS